MVTKASVSEWSEKLQYRVDEDADYENKYVRAPI